MRRPLQNAGDGDYVRPGDPWVCGLTTDGPACPFGPTGSGHCPALAECVPVAGGRGWRCNRSEVRGGPCPEGPNADGRCCHAHLCTPIRGMRSRRKRFILGATLFVAGLSLAILSSNWRSEAIIPGPLARHHAQILTEKNRCDACHPAGGESPLEWALAVSWGRSDGIDQTMLCMKCHQELAPAELSRLAHNLPPDHLEILTREQGGAANAPGGNNTKLELACSVCHQEHHGADHNLSLLTDAQCQTCHHQQFASFASDHSDFGAWPYQRPEQIAFDHAAHFAKHFPAESQSFACAQCHIDDATGDVKLLVHFDQACAKCHEKNIQASIPEGIAAFALPTLDVDLLDEAGEDVGEWPDWATGDFDGELPAVMQVLLAADPAVATAMAELGEGFTFADVDPDNPKQVAAAATISRGIKQLLDSLAKDGHVALLERLPKESPTKLKELTGQLPIDSPRAAIESWFGEPQEISEKTALELAKQSSQGGWFRDDRTMTIRYQPTGHADPWLRAWLDVAVRIENPQLRRALLADLGRPTSPGTCLSCHQLQDGGRSIAWSGFDRRDEPRSFTKFSHRPHVLQPKLADCSHCHELNLPENNAATVVSVSTAIHPHDFLPISKHSCVSCHTASAAGDACIQCHNYHVDPRSLNLNSPLSSTAQEKQREKNTNRR